MQDAYLLVLKAVIQSGKVQDRLQTLSQLSQFRSNPSSIVPHLKQRISRYRKHGGSEFLFSRVHKKKALQPNQSQNQSRIRQLITILETRTIKLQQLKTSPRLDQIASKLCEIIMPQMSSGIQFKPNTSILLRQFLNSDTQYSYPSSVSCLVALSFNEPYQSLMSLLVDDGLPKRPNRNALLDERMRYLGLASMECFDQPQFRCAVYVLTEDIIPKQRSQVKSNTSIENNDRIDSKQNISEIHQSYAEHGSQQSISKQMPSQIISNPPQSSINQSGEEHKNNMSISNSSNMGKPPSLNGNQKRNEYSIVIHDKTQNHEKPASRINFTYNPPSASQNSSPNNSPELSGNARQNAPQGWRKQASISHSQDYFMEQVNDKGQ